MIQKGGPPLSNPSCQDLPITPHPTMNRRLIDLIRSTTEEGLRPILDQHFSEEAEDLIAAFRRLRALDAAPDVGLVLRLDRDGDDVVVGGTDPKTGDDYALDLLPWAAYLGLAVPDAMLDEFHAEEVIAHVLGEMTFYGTTEESVANTLKEVLRLKPDAGREGTGAGGQ
jgi:hypothetical protein